MKKVIISILLITLVLFLFSSCDNTLEKKIEEEKKSETIPRDGDRVGELKAKLSSTTTLTLGYVDGPNGISDIPLDNTVQLPTILCTWILEHQPTETNTYVIKNMNAKTGHIEGLESGEGKGDKYYMITMTYRPN